VPLGPEPDTGVDLELSESDEAPRDGSKPYDPTVWGAL